MVVATEGLTEATVTPVIPDKTKSVVRGVTDFGAKSLLVIFTTYVVPLKAEVQ